MCTEGEVRGSSEAQRPRSLEHENSHLKRLVAGLSLDKAMLGNRGSGRLDKGGLGGEGLPAIRPAWLELRRRNWTALRLSEGGRRRFPAAEEKRHIVGTLFFGRIGGRWWRPGESLSRQNLPRSALTIRSPPVSDIDLCLFCTSDRCFARTVAVAHLNRTLASAEKQQSSATDRVLSAGLRSYGAELPRARLTAAGPG